MLLIGIALKVLVVVVEAANVRPAAIIPGDFTIGALFRVHDPPSDHTALVCGRIREQYGIQRIEAALMTLHKINQDKNILRGITLGLEARDSCWSPLVALQQTMVLAWGAMNPALTQNHSQSNNSACQSDLSESTTPSGKAPVIGVVGPGSSAVAIQVQNLLQLFSIPQIGYSTTSSEFNDRAKYTTFLRVVPCDSFQARAMVDIVTRFNWTYVSVVNTEGTYGQKGMQYFRELAEEQDICIAREDVVPSSLPIDDPSFERIIHNLNQDHAANVVVCFCEGATVTGLLNATKRLNLTGRFTFIGSDGWADRYDVVEDLEEEAWGSLSIRIYSPYIPEFEEHYFSLSPFDNKANPWFVEFWQYKFNCTVSSADISNTTASPSEADSVNERRICTGTEDLSHRYIQDSKMSFVIKSIWAMAYGLHRTLEDVCGYYYSGACKEMYPFNGSLFYKHLTKISFAFGDEVVKFDHLGNPPARYEIMNFQRLPNNSFAYVHIGDWNNRILNLTKELQSRGKHLVASVCSLPCPVGYYKNLKVGGQEKKCCWACAACGDYQFVSTDKLSCVDCPLGHRPNDEKTHCLVIVAEYISWGDVTAILAMSFSVIGLVVTFVTFYVFIKYNDTPVVKASTRELSYLILVGMVLAHISVFPILAKPSPISCTLERSMPGISFAIMYASLLTKTNRIARILAVSKKRFPKRKYRFMSATALVVMTSCLIILEATISGVMLVLEPPMPHLEYPSRDRSVLTCATSPRAVLTPLAFNFFLLGLCTLYAIKTRNVPENFNEAKFIGFAMYTTCVIWIAFVCIYCSDRSKVVVMCMCITLSASVTLVFLFFPKLYIIIFKPEKNNRALFITSKSVRTHIGARVAAALVEPPAKQLIYSIAGNPEMSRQSTLRKIVSVQTDPELFVTDWQDLKEPLPTSHLNSSMRDFEINSNLKRDRAMERVSKSSENLSATINSEDLITRSSIDVFRSQDKICQISTANKNLICHRNSNSVLCEPLKWAQLDLKMLLSTRSIESNAQTKEEESRIYKSQARIREEHHGHSSSNGDSIINITITL